MAAKGSTAAKEFKIQQREVMVTRHKSAQMKRQLRVKDRSMKHLTDLLKSPTKESQAKAGPAKKKPSPKAKSSLLKSVEKIQNLPQKTFKLSKVLRKEILLVEDEEYHPNKRKRKIAVNKVVLKPKPSMKVVGEITGSVKRKYSVPLKVSDKPTPAPQFTQTAPKLSPERVKLSMLEAIQVMDEQLTDEDLMEILTCPSPVWWEDPPDEQYIEDALFTRPPSVTEKGDVTPSNPTPVPMEIDQTDDNDTNKIIPIPNLGAKSDKFLKKRSKLEDLLGNIKSNKDKSNNNKEKNKNNEDKSKNNEQNSGKNTTKVKYKDPNNHAGNKIQGESKHSTSNEINKVVNQSNDNNEISKDVPKNTKTNEAKVVDLDKNKGKLEAKLSESDDEIALHNSSMNEDELLKDLENMDIPIASDVIVIDDDDDFLDKTTSEETIESKNDIELDSKVTEDTDKIDSKEIEMSKKLSALESNCDQIASRKSMDSLCSKSSVTLSGKDIDTISDTNVRFLLEDEDDNKTKVASQESITSSQETDKRATDDSVTVYKIIEEIDGKTDITNDLNEKTTENDIHNIVDAKLNDYFKKCKKVYLKRKNEKTDINKNEMTDCTDYKTVSCEKCIPAFRKVSENENVKYCLKCSAIFDSKDCTYCMKNTNRTCVPCKLKFCCESYLIKHISNCELARRVVYMKKDGVSETIDSLVAKIRVST